MKTELMGTTTIVDINNYSFVAKTQNTGEATFLAFEHYNCKLSVEIKLFILNMNKSDLEILSDLCMGTDLDLDLRGFIYETYNRLTYHIEKLNNISEGL